MEAELRRFSHRADEKQHAAQGQRRNLPAKKWHHLLHRAGRLAEHGVKIERPEQHEHRENAKREAEIADAIDDKSLDRRCVGRGAVVPEANQQVRGEPHTFPAEKHLDEVVGGDQGQHEEGEKAQIGHKPRDRVVMGHVADGIDVDHRGDDGHDEDHHPRERIEP